MPIQLKDEIRKIIQLQKIDTDIYNFNLQNNIQLPAQLSAIKSSFEERKQTLAAFEEKVKVTLLKKKEKELDLASKEENLSKSQGQLYQLKTNKEYQAKLSEIGAAKADISVVEEDILKIFEEIELADIELKKQKELLSQEEKTFKEKENEVSNKIKEAQIQIKILEDKRNISAKDVSQEILSKYEQLLKTRQGSAIVPVKDSNCGSCHMRITHQTINEIKMYDNLVLCGNCVRILYIPEDLE
ncbi:MAG: C4-type zinc ribbon domain-containing protein [Candidatus Omnitrophota bacterium]